MTRFRRDLTAAVLVWLVSFGAVDLPTFGRDTKLTIHPAKAEAPPGGHALLPKQEVLVDGDAVVLYDKAANALPADFRTDQIKQWLDLPVEQLPLRQVEETLQRHMESLRSTAKAARCRQCNWPQWKPVMPPMNLQGYKKLAFVVALWGRLEIAQGGYEGAMLAIQTGYGMARHIGQGPTLVQTLVAVAVGAVMCNEVEQFVQGENSPNLYRALANLPRPFVDVEKAIQNERKATLAHAQSESLGRQSEAELEKVYDRVRRLVRKLDSHLTLLQCVEALRSYAASHAGRLPEKLSDISDVELPTSLTTGEGYAYRRTGSTARLESAIPDGGDEDDQIRYEIVVKD